MNAPVLVAQLSGAAPQTTTPPKNLKLEKPQNGQAITVHLDGNTRLDFTDIASEKLTFVKVGEKLIVLFDNQSTVTVDPVFDSGGHPLANVAFEVGPDRIVTGDEFASLFPITTDQSVLPAAGNGGNGPTGGANFSDPHVSALNDPNNPLALLGDENTNSQFSALNDQVPGSAPTASGADAGSINEDRLPGGNVDGSGSLSVTGSLHIDFGSSAASRELSFDIAQPGLSGLTSGGQAISLLITTVNGVPTLIGYVGADSGNAANYVFTVSLNAGPIEGEYTFNLLRPLDHAVHGSEDLLGLTINVIGSDTAGQVTTAINISVQDDVPVIVAANETHTTLLDPVSGGVATETGSLGISWGSDRFNDHVNGGTSTGNGDRAVVFADQAVLATGNGEGGATSIAQLTSHGEAVHYVLADNGTTLIAYTGTAVPTGAPADAAAAAAAHVVFVVTLSDSGDTGGYSISQYQPLDHDAGGQTFSSIDLKFNFTATDSDGDPASGVLNVTIADTNPVSTGAIADTTVAESTQQGGSNGFIPASTSESLHINWNADDANPTAGAGSHDRSVAFTDATIAALVAQGLTSNGQSLSYAITTAADGSSVLTASVQTGEGETAQARVVFTVTLSDDGSGSYTFNLLDNLDHSIGSGKNDLALAFDNVVATDSDGDTVPVHFTVHVTDDVPLVTAPSQAGSIDESHLVAHGEQQGQTQSAFGNLNIDWNADDKNTHLEFASTTITDGNGHALTLTSDGVALDFTVRQAGNGADQELVAYKHGDPLGADNPVFIVSLNAPVNPAYIFTLFQNLDHPGQGADTLSLHFTVNGFDGDGDSVQQTFAVDIKDDVPTAGTVTDGTVVESTQSGESNAFVAASVSESLNIHWNADDANPTAGAGAHDRSVAFTDATVAALVAQGLTSNGQSLHYVISTGADGSSVLTASVQTGEGEGAQSHTVFTVTLSDDGSGSYTFNLLDNLDHANTQGKNDLALTFDNVVATDSDGDTAPVHFTVHVTDDIPTAGEIADSTVAESTQSGGNNAFIPASASESLHIDWNSDDANPTAGAGTHDRSVAFTDATIATLVAQGLTSNGQSLHYVISTGADGSSVLTASVQTGEGEGAQSHTVFTVTLSDDGSGSYTFNLLDNLDHANIQGKNDLALTFDNVVATDSDGDTVPVQFTVHVTDDVPTAGEIADSTVAESTQSGGNNAFIPASVSESLHIDWNSDDANPTAGAGTHDRSVAFTDATIATLAAQGLTSNGQSLHYAITTAADGSSVLTASVQTGEGEGVQSHTVFTVTLSDDGSGSYTFNLLDNLDHSTGSGKNDLALTFDNVVATDSDGDTVPVHFTVHVTDDVPTAGEIADSTVAESTQSGENNAFIPASASESLHIDWNADDANPTAGAGAHDRSVAFTDATIATLAAQGLTSNGQSLHYAISTASDGSSVLTASVQTGEGEGAQSHTVFTVTLSDDGSGSYTFNLLDNLDHANIQGKNDLALTFDNVVATDSDGDTVPVHFTVHVTDDIPTAGEIADATVVESTENGESNAFISAAISASLHIDWNADDANPTAGAGAHDRSVAFTDATVAALVAQGLTSNGQSLHYVISTGADGSSVLTASVQTGEGEGAQSHTVFTVTLSDDGSGSYTFNLLDNLDHSTGSGKNDLALTFDNVVATDSDGDTAPVHFTVHVTDDIPTAGEIAQQTVGEDGLAGANPSGPVGSFDAVDNTTASNVSLNINWGADDDIHTGANDQFGRTLSFLSAQQGEGEQTLTAIAGSDATVSNLALAITGEAGSELSSGGVALQYVVTALANGGEVLTAYKGDARGDDARVFTLTLDPTQPHGSYSFELLGTLDHQSDANHLSNSDSIGLTFTVQAADADGDTVNTSFTVNVQDDVPVIVAPVAGENLIQNGSFTDGTWSDASYGSTGDAAGWTYMVGGENSGQHLERVNLPYSVGGATVHGNGQALDLDLSPGDVALSQAVAGVQANEVYTLSFNAGGLSGFSAGLDVYWGGEKVLSLTQAELAGDMRSYAVNVLGGAGDGSNLLTFQETGTPDNSGTFLADVSLTLAGTPTVVDEDGGLSGGNAGGPGDVAAMNHAIGALGIHWGADVTDTAADANGLQDGAQLDSESSPTALTGRAVYFTDSAVAVSFDVNGEGNQHPTLTSNGQVVQFRVVNDGTTLEGYVHSEGKEGGDSVVFTVSLSDDGSGHYDFKLLGTLDHPVAGTEDNIALTFNYTARDFDGDTASSTFTVTVNDDTPTIGAVAVQYVDEEGVNGNAGDSYPQNGFGTPGDVEGSATTAHASLNISWGADAGNSNLDGGFSGSQINGDRSVVFSADAISHLQDQHLTSDGVGLQYELSSDGTTLTAYKGDTHSPTTEVFQVHLSDSGNGSYDFNLTGNLDHPIANTEDNLALTFGFTARDGDGDGVSSSFDVVVNDDAPVAGQAVNGVVDEDGGFFTGNPGGNGDVSAGTVALYSLGISWGADNDLKSEPLSNGTIGSVDDPIGRTLSFAASGGSSVLGGTATFVSGSNVTPEISVTDTASGQTTDVTAALTSDGVGLSYALSYHTDSSGNWDGGYVLVAYKSTGSADHAGDQVFRVTIDPTSANGSYKFELLGNLDHPVANTEDNLNLTFGLVAADADGDQIHTAFTVAVNDDTPITILSIPDSNVEEEQLANGNEDAKGAGDNDLNVLGHIVNLTTAHADGLLNVSWGSDSGNSQLDGGFTGTQVNGDRSVVFATGSGQDQTLTDPNQIKAFLSVSDNGQGYDPTTLTSGGVALQYVLSANGTTLTAYAGDPELGHKVFTVSLSDQGLLGTGAYSFDLLGVLDHPVHGTSASQEDALSFKFTFTARDGDGDSTSDHFTVNVSDDSPVAAVGTASTVEDESLPGGNNETETPNLSASVSHVSLNIAWGADNSNPTEHGGLGDRSVAFTDNHVAVAGAYNGSTLTSLGQAVSYAILSDGQLVGYTGATAPTSIHGGNVVFYASLSDGNNGEYNFTLVKPLDQSAGHGENSLTLTFNYTATDSDGDTSSNHFTVSVVDDVPLIDTTHVQNGTVEEEQPIVVGAGNEDASGAGDADQSILGFIYNDRTTEKATGSLGVNWGSDNANDNNGQPGDRSVQFVTGLSAPEGLTSRGEDVHYKVFTVGGEQTLVAYTGAEPTSVPATTQAAIAAHVVFTVALSDVSAHGDYTFTLVDVLDQHQQGEDSLPLTFGYTATDSDGDTTAPGSFTVSVIDDTPIAIGTIAPCFVEEEELAGGNEDTQGAGDGDFSVFGLPVDVTTAHADGLLNILWGGDDSNKNVNGGFVAGQADGDRSVVFGGANGDYIADGKVDPTLAANFLSVAGGHGDISLGSLTSGGVAVQYVLSNHGTTLTAYAGDPSLGHKVFTVTLSDQNGGAYDFQLNGVLDHPVHGTSAGQEDTLSFNFTFTARDSDGDIAQNDFTVNVIDDSPVTSGTVAARVVGEDGLPGANLTGGSYDADDHAGVSNVALNVNWGADNDIHTGAGDLVGRTLSFNMVGGVPVDGSGHALALSSDGVTLSYSVVDLVNGGQELHAYKGTDTAANRVFTVTLDPTSDHGSYSFTLNGNLDHAASGAKGNELPLDFGLTATDSDGDTVGTHFTVKVQDDTPTIGTAATTNVNEDDLPNGNDLFKETRTVHGDLAIHWGADDGAAKHILMAANGLPADLTSDGVAIDYQTTVDADGNAVVVAYKHGGSATSASDQVFSLNFNENGSGTYTFKLLGNLDHDVGSDDRALQFTVNATDSDGDSVAQNFTVHVADDTPIAIGTILTRTVEEEELSGGNEDTQGAGDADFSVFGIPVDVTTGHANGLLNILWGGDDANRNVDGGYNGTQIFGDRSVVFGGTAGAHIADGTVSAADASAFVSVSGGHGSIGLADLTSGGVALQYVLSGNGTVLTAYAGSTHDAAHAVFTVTLSDQNGGSYDFQLNGALDHPMHGTSASQEDTLSFNFTFTARDGDGDIAQNNFAVNVIDDSPVINAANIQNGAVDEDALANGNAGDSYPEGSVPAELSGVLPVVHNTLGTAGDINATNQASGTLGVSWGADHGAARTLTFDQSSLPTGLKSGGADVHIWVSADGTKLEGYTGAVSTTEPSNPVFTVTLDATAPNGAYTFLLQQPLDQPVANQEDSINLKFGFIATDSDGDTASSSFTVAVNDDAPTADYLGLATIQESVNADGSFHAVTDSGTLPFHAGADGATVTNLLYRFSGTPNVVADGDATGFSTTPMTSGGLPVTITQTISGGFITLTGATTSGTIFTFQVNQATGAYTYTQSGPLDHPDHGVNGSETGSADPVVLTFDYIVTDRDGDNATGAINVAIDDDGPTATLSKLVTQESANADGSFHVAPVTSHFVFTPGADGAKVTAIHYDFGNNIADGDAPTFTSLPLTSGGQQVTVTESADHLTLTGALANGDKVFVIQVTNPTTGEYTYTQYAPLDHPDINESGAQDPLRMRISFTVTDGDGDTATNHIQLDVNDDAPTATLSKLVTQESANADGSFHVAPVTSHFVFTPGADGAKVTAIHYDFGNNIADGDAPTFTSLPLTSGGQQVTVTESADHLTLTGALANGDKVFVIQVTNPTTGEYTYTQYAPLDHPDINESGAQDPLRMRISFTVTDGDGDTATNHIQLDVNDDAPTATLSKLVTQESANADGSFHVAPVTSHFVFTPGADGAKVTAIHYDFGNNIADGDAPTFTSLPLTSGGQQVTVTESADHLTLTGALANGDKVFVIQVTNPTTGEYTYTQYAPLDHPDINESGAQDPLRMRISFTVTDGDGDTATNHIQLDVNDDAPTATLSKLVTQESANADGSFHVAPVTSHFVFTPGADGAKVTAIHYDFGNNIADGDAPTFTSLPLTSGGQQVTVTESADHLTLTGALANGDKVFVIQVTNPTTGEYTYTQYAPLDHPDINESGAQDPLRMRISFTVTDGDGDTATNHIQLDVNDDAPTISGNATQANFLTNGDFTGGTFAHPESWGQWATEDTGWHITGTVAGQTGVQLERVQDGYLGMHSSNGHPMVDLGATPGDIQISQTISGLNSGQHYTLSFEVGSPSPGSAGLEVYWNGTLVHTYAPGSTMSLQTLDLTAGAGANTLSFKEIGNPNDNTGTYLANVSLTAASAAALPVFHADAQENGTQTFHLVSGSDFSFGADGPGSVAFDMTHATIASPTGTTLGMPTLSYDPATGTLTMTPGYAFDGLSQGEIATLSVPFTITDGDGDTKTGVYQFTITGTNDGVSTSEGFPDHMTMTEYAETDPRAGSTDDRTVFDAPAGHAGYNGGGFWLYDADQGDTHTISVVPQGTNYLGTLEAVVSEETSGDGVGFVTWHYHVTDAELNQLGAGETRDEVFRVNIDDGHGGTAYRDITVTLVGSEDAPDIFVGQNDNSTLFLNETNTTLMGSGTLSVSDVDHTDTVHASVTGVAWTLSSGSTMYSDAGLLNMFHVSPDPVLTPGDTRQASLAWAFNSGGNAFNFLGEGVVATLTYTVEVNDGLEIDTQQVTVTITGTNDAPVITGSTNPDPILESLGDSSMQDIAATTGTLTVFDADRGDNLHPSVTGNAVAAWSGGTLPAGVDVTALIAASAISFAPDHTSAANSQVFNWTYDPAAANLDWLADGQTLTITYQAQVDDGHGAVGTQPLTVTITGTNDAPHISVAAGDSDHSFLTETNAGLSAHGTLTATDVDVSDVVNATVVSVDASGSGIEHVYTNDFLKSLLTVGTNPVIDGSHTTGQIAWTFDSGTEAFNFLPAGWESVLNYTIQVSDGHGGTDQHVVQIKLHGTNDGPAFGWGETAAPLHEVANQTGSPEVLTKTGQLLFADADDGDTHSIVSITPVSTNNPGGGYLGDFTAWVSREPDHANTDASLHNGQVMWKLTATDSSLDFLAEGQVVTQQYLITLQDASGAQTTQTVTATFTGSNDAPVVDLSGSSVAGNDVVTTAVEQLPQWIVNSATINDVDSPTMASLTATLVSPPDGALEGLSLNATALAAASANGISWNYDATTGALTVTGEAATSVYQTILQGIVYLNNSDNPATTDRTIHVVVNDGLADSAQQTATVHVWATNDPPVLDGTLHAVMDEGSSHTIVPSELGFTDPDNVASEVSFIVSNQVNGIIKLDGVPSLSFTGQQLLDGHVTFVHDGSETTTATFDVKVEDGNQDGSVPVSQTFHIDVTPVNDAPTAVADVYSDTPVSEQGVGPGNTPFAGQPNASGNVLTNDTDADIGDSKTVIGVAVGLAASAVGGVGTVLHGTYGDLTLSSDGSYHYVLDNSRAATDALAVGAVGHDVFTYTMQDSAGASSSTTLTVDVNGTNDAPTLSVAAPSNDLTEAGYNVAGVSVATAQVSIHDVDTGDNPHFDVTGWIDAGNGHVTQSGTYGTFDLDTTTGQVKYTLDDSRPATEALSSGDTKTDSVLVTVDDGHGASASHAVAFTIHGSDDVQPLTAVNDTIYTNGTSKLTIFGESLLWNDQAAEHGVLSIANGQGAGVNYNSNTDALKFTEPSSGHDQTFAYSVTDGSESSTGNVTVHYTTTFTPTSGDDFFISSSSNGDTLHLGDGNDVMFGSGSASSTIYGDGGNDLIVGGNGVNTNNLYGGSGNDVIYAGTGGNQNIWGDDGNDTIYGSDSAGHVELHGGSGDDTIYSGEQFGTLIYGDDGNDRIYGVGVSAQIQGGSGNDTFLFDHVGWNADKVLDYSTADTIDLTAMLGPAAGIADDGSNIGNFVSLTQSGSDISVHVDVTGHHNFDGQSAVILQGYGTSNADIVNIAFQSIHNQTEHIAMTA